MKTEIKKLWINALTSGEYEQTKGVLNNGSGGFCCLGVLCDLYIKSQDDAYWMENNAFQFHDSTEDEDFDQGWDADLPQAVMDWAGLETQHGKYGLEKLPRRNLVRDNDGGKNFKLIASIIGKEF